MKKGVLESSVINERFQIECATYTSPKRGRDHFLFQAVLFIPIFSTQESYPNSTQNDVFLARLLAVSAVKKHTAVVEW